MIQQTPIVYPLNEIKPWMQLLLKTVAGSFFIALCAQICIPLPFTPVPITCTTLAIIFLGITLGSKQATACTICYFLEGTAGLPVLAGGLINPLDMLGPWGGYHFADIVLAYMAGMASSKKTLFYNIAILSVASLLVLFAGSCGLAQFVGWPNAFGMGFYPFIPGDALKVLIAAFYLHVRR